MSLALRRILAGSGVTLNTAVSINDHVVIVDTAVTADGSTATTADDGTDGYELTPAS